MKPAKSSARFGPSSSVTGAAAMEDAQAEHRDDERGGWLGRQRVVDAEHRTIRRDQVLARIETLGGAADAFVAAQHPAEVARRTAGPCLHVCRQLRRREGVVALVAGEERRALVRLVIT